MNSYSINFKKGTLLPARLGHNKVVDKCSSDPEVGCNATGRRTIERPLIEAQIRRSNRQFSASETH